MELLVLKLQELGELNYQAWGRVVPHIAGHPFRQLPVDTQAAWMEGARAVLRASGFRGILTEPNVRDYLDRRGPRA